MKSIGFPPGAFNFRLAFMVIIIAVLWVIFLNYSDEISIETEKASIQQTKNIINSSLVVVFATYAVKQQLDRLNELVEENPFVSLAEYNVVPVNYRGERDIVNTNNIKPGWYYDRSSRKVIYKASYSDDIYFYSIIFEYRDANGSGRFESGIDEFGRIYFEQL